MSTVNLKTVASYVPKLITLLELIQGATGIGGPIAGEALVALHAAVTTALAGDAQAGDLDVAIANLEKALANLKTAVASDDKTEDAELAAKFAAPVKP